MAATAAGAGAPPGGSAAGADLRKKVLLMGKSGSGKTSMRSVIFANYLARDTARLNPTLDVQHSSVRFLGSLVLNLWDCGGQDVFFDQYFGAKRDHMFTNVSVLIYVFDINSVDAEGDLRYFQSVMEALKQNSPEVKVFTLIHKMDLVAEGMRDEVYNERVEAIRANAWGLPFKPFRTSIWDETLYKAWSDIVLSLIPNVRMLEDNLATFASMCDADEVVLFEKATFLVISNTTRKPHSDVHRFEKISNIVKQFKLSCMKAQAQFRGLRVGNSTFTAFIDNFTSNTYIMVVTSDPHISDEATMLNIAMGRKHFDSIISEI